MDSVSYLKTFLEASDLPAGMTRTQDSRTRGADPGDRAFAQYRGLYSGLAVWMADDAAPVWRVVDIRWVFQTEAEADAYHRATLNVNCEGEAHLPNAPSAGRDCYVFGGTRGDDFYLAVTGNATTITQFYYLFRVGRVVVKLYVAEGDMAARRGQKLTVPAVKQIADRIVARLNAVEGSANQAPSLWKRLFG